MWIEDLGRDLQYAQRTLLRSPGFTLAAVLTLGVAHRRRDRGVQLVRRRPASAAAVSLRRPPGPAVRRELPERALPATRSGRAPTPRGPADNEVFDSVAAVAGYSAVLTWRGQPERITARRVTAPFSTCCRASPCSAAPSRADEDRPGGERVAIISHGFWQRRFGGDSAVIGRHLILDDVPHSSSA